MSSITRFIATHAVPTYFGLAFVISWGGVLLVIGGPAGIPGTSEELERLFPSAFLAMLTGPSIAGILLTGLVHGRTGFRALLSRLLEWRVGIRWYAVALLTAPLSMLGVLLALSLISPEYLPGIFTSGDKASLLLFGIAVGLGAGIFEELGWTGFAIPGLRLRDGVFETGVVVGVLWGAWHLLTNVFWGSDTSSGALSAMVYLTVRSVGLVVGGLVAYRILMVWVYDRTGSLLVAMLMHVSLTASTLILGPAAISGGPLVTYDLLLGAALWIVVAAVAVANGWRFTRQQPLRTRAA